MEYVRFRSKYPNRYGEFVGIFGLVNVLGRHGMLTPDEERFRRENNAWYDAAYPDPCHTDRSWTRTTSPGNNCGRPTPAGSSIATTGKSSWCRTTTRRPWAPE
jgi:hypothetical protein